MFFCFFLWYSPQRIKPCYTVCLSTVDLAICVPPNSTSPCLLHSDPISGNFNSSWTFEVCFHHTVLLIPLCNMLLRSRLPQYSLPGCWCHTLQSHQPLIHSTPPVLFLHHFLPPYCSSISRDVSMRDKWKPHLEPLTVLFFSGFYLHFLPVHINTMGLDTLSAPII